LTFSSLFPSTVRPRHGIFVETRLRHLLREGHIDARVIAPVPWFPFRSKWFGSYARIASTPRRELRSGGVDVSYPRYVMLPKVGVALQPDAMARSCIADVQSWIDNGWRPDLIDAHYFYPDGVAAALVAQRFQTPFVVTARGTDVNVIARQPGPGRRVLWAARRAAAVVAVSSSLKQALIELGVDPAKIIVLRNGVDTTVFHPRDRAAARGELGLQRRHALVCVGNLVPEKGFELAIEALTAIPDADLLLVGEGPQRSSLLDSARQAGVADRVRIVGSMSQAKLAEVYTAADALLLCSTREGWPNVLLEAMACGAPVVATSVGAVEEIITSPRVGRIVASRDAGDFGAAVRDLLRSEPRATDIVQHAAAYDWATVSRGQVDLFRRVLATTPRPALQPC
jgi:glycosyltransferase involved in cell wall biosynthesis